MIESFETSTSNKSVQNGCSDLYGALNASGRYPMTAMTKKKKGNEWPL